jgi:hypothetical protein
MLDNTDLERSSKLVCGTAGHALMIAASTSRDPMEYPNGSGDGLCSASATAFALCVAFLAAWGFQGQGHWRAVDLLVVVPLSVATLGFGATPLLATKPTKESGIGAARGLYGVSVLLVMISVISALVIEFGK